MSTIFILPNGKALRPRWRKKGAIFLLSSSRLQFVLGKGKKGEIVTRKKGGGGHQLLMG